MNCDDAFELLTDSVGRSDAALERHLAGCARCRAMSETLSPALGLMQRVATSDSVSASTTKVATKAARRLSQQSRPSVLPSHQGVGRRTVLALAASFGMAACAFAVFTVDHLNHSGGIAPGEHVCLWKFQGGSSGGKSAAMVTAACASCHLQLPTSPSTVQ
jgi:hypothetical protein